MHITRTGLPGGREGGRAGSLGGVLPGDHQEDHQALPALPRARGEERRMHAHEVPAAPVPAGVVLELQLRVEPCLHGRPLVRRVAAAGPLSALELRVQRRLPSPFLHTHTHARTHMHAHTCTHTFARTHMCAHIGTHMHTVLSKMTAAGLGSSRPRVDCAGKSSSTRSRSGPRTAACGRHEPPPGGLASRELEAAGRDGAVSGLTPRAPPPAGAGRSDGGRCRASVSVLGRWPQPSGLDSPPTRGSVFPRKRSSSRTRSPGSLSAGMSLPLHKAGAAHVRSHGGRPH
uniref:Parkin RBR E3 ubiquitin protein ligase n=1 Tax=Myotis myotis TaxID=51298 RepID=A0A7J7WWT2_MYOMY|nr:parkin RBR E3 ubiquitin protein ligase [Myotis myotis]